MSELSEEFETLSISNSGLISDTEKQTINFPEFISTLSTEHAGDYVDLKSQLSKILESKSDIVSFDKTVQISSDAKEVTITSAEYTHFDFISEIKFVPDEAQSYQPCSVNLVIDGGVVPVTDELMFIYIATPYGRNYIKIASDQPVSGVLHYRGHSFTKPEKLKPVLSSHIECTGIGYAEGSAFPIRLSAE